VARKLWLLLTVHNYAIEMTRALEPSNSRDVVSTSVHVSSLAGQGSGVNLDGVLWESRRRFRRLG